MKPDVSIIMPCYNAAPWLGQSIESVLRQSFPAWELLIIDDGSTDGSRALAARHAARDPRIRLLDNAGRKGAGDARNTGLARARGEAVAFLDSDDVYFPGALAALHARLRESGEPAVRGRGMLLCMQRWLASTRGLPAEALRSGSERVTYPTSTFWLHMFRADFLRRRGILFAPDLPRGQDFHFLSHAYTSLDSLPVVDEIVHLYRYNHRRGPITASHAESYLALARNIRSLFQGTAKETQIVPCVESFLLARWLHCLHAMRQEGQERAEDYLARCLALFSEKKEEFAPALGRILGGAQERFLTLWGREDMQGILELLDEERLLAPSYPFPGIERRPEETFWPAYTLSRRMANFVRNPQTRRALFYLLSLRLRCLKRQKSASAQGAPRLMPGHMAETADPGSGRTAGRTVKPS